MPYVCDATSSSSSVQEDTDNPHRVRLKVGVDIGGVAAVIAKWRKTENSNAWLLWCGTFTLCARFGLSPRQHRYCTATASLLHRHRTASTWSRTFTWPKTCGRWPTSVSIKTALKGRVTPNTTEGKNKSWCLWSEIDFARQPARIQLHGPRCTSFKWTVQFLFFLGQQPCYH